MYILGNTHSSWLSSVHVVTICLVDGQTDVESQYELCEHKLQYESSGTSVQGRGHTV